ncbi:hypothetical protein L249_8706 [Ophiocordyceps polyrhachis-furcata BCC 54312]|uniref:DNA-directed RNA polymerase I, II, and III subunit RPABC4 n=1 Tax=Ophiocordyceps polyrhachis-furcata BCC 54312 TaxID=1330021 RepID=A0A367L763_9HYPO|nr:hypothetical protein L249_8706 [Ophiocordyceps polyrhachis-furcata BCC 54312]
MPREEYQVPTAAGGGAQPSSSSSSGPGPGPGAASASAARGSTRDALDARSGMSYICGDCGGTVTLSKDALVACPHCAGRVLYKGRTKRMVQFEAR